MEIKGVNLLDKCARKNAIARNALQQWVEVVGDAQWKNHNDIKETFPSADYIGNGQYVFNIKGNGFRIIALVIFILGTLTIRFVGTHAEYDKFNKK